MGSKLQSINYINKRKIGAITQQNSSNILFLNNNSNNNKNNTIPSQLTTIAKTSDNIQEFIDQTDKEDCNNYLFPEPNRNYFTDYMKRTIKVNYFLILTERKCWINWGKILFEI